MNRRSLLQTSVAAWVLFAGRLFVRESPLAGASGELHVSQGALALPELTRDGTLFRTDDGRTTILRGVDYATSIGLMDEPVRLDNEDLDRIASWGVNLLRVRLRDYHAGYFGDDPEDEYLGQIDGIISAANQRGM